MNAEQAAIAECFIGIRPTERPNKALVSEIIQVFVKYKTPMYEIVDTLNHIKDAMVQYKDRVVLTNVECQFPPQLSTNYPSGTCFDIRITERTEIPST